MILQCNKPECGHSYWQHQPDKPGKCKFPGCSCSSTQQEVYESSAQEPAATTPTPPQPAATTPTPRHGLYIISFIAIVGLALTTGVSIYYQYVPSNITQNVLETPNHAFVIYVHRPSTLQVPLRNVFEAVVKNITLEVVFNRPNISGIAGIHLFTTSDSILSYSGTFQTQFFCRSDGTIVPRSGPEIPKTCPAKYGVLHSISFVSAKHNLEIGNTSNPYTIDITYTNATDDTTPHQGVVFSWPIKTLDFNLLSYFWIVLIGVIVSRLFKRYTDQQSPTGKSNERPIGVYDYLWIVFSGVIALLIFSNFQQQVHSTTQIIINISLAFGFGFGFDKVLEAGQKLEKTQSP